MTPDYGIPVYVDEIVVSGVQRTSNNILKKQLIENVTETKEKLVNLGIFNSVYATIDAANNKNANDYRVIFKVEEKRFTTAKVNCTHGTDGITKATGSVQLNNIAGNGEKAHIDLEVGLNQMISKFATFSKPLESNPAIHVSLGGTEGNWDHSWAKFLRHERSVFTEVCAHTPVGLHKFQWNANWREIKARDLSAPLSVLKESGPHLKCALSHLFECDTRADLVFPDAGFLCKFMQEMSTITPGSLTQMPTGDTSLGLKDDSSIQLKLENTFQKPFRLTDWLVAELTMSAGLLHSFTGHRTHIADRFFLGGPLELRGFAWRSVSSMEPKLQPSILTIDNGSAGAAVNNYSPIGSDAFWLTGLHFYTPLPYWGVRQGSFAENFRLHGFCTAGSTMDNPLHHILDDATATESLASRICAEVKGKPRVVLGLGVVMRMLNFLRMELNYCFPVKTQFGDHVKSGFTFGFGIYYM